MFSQDDFDVIGTQECARILTAADHVEDYENAIHNFGEVAHRLNRQVISPNRVKLNGKLIALL